MPVSATATRESPEGTSMRGVVMSRSSTLIRKRSTLIGSTLIGSTSAVTMECMGACVGAAEATRILGVRPETLYAYVSRGLIGRRVGPDGRRSLYDRDDIEALARR